MKTKLLLVMLTIESMTFVSCKNCCEGGGVEVCKKDGYTTEEWKDIVDACEDTPGCDCGA